MLGSLTHDEILVEAKRRLGGSGDQAALNISVGNENFSDAAKECFSPE
jgi:hypothetical protein